MERIESVYFYKDKLSFLEKLFNSGLNQVVHRFSNVSDEEFKNLDNLIKKNYFYFGFIGEKSELGDCITYTRGGKSFVMVYNGGKGGISITHVYPNCSLDNVLSSIDREKGKVTRF